MSFTTDKPFFPYREPADQRENLPAGDKGKGRTLRLFVLMPDRAAGALEESYVWPGVAKYARPANAGGLLGAAPVYARAERVAYLVRGHVEPAPRRDRSLLQRRERQGRARAPEAHGRCTICRSRCHSTGWSSSPSGSPTWAIDSGRAGAAIGGSAFERRG